MNVIRFEEIRNGYLIIYKGQATHYRTYDAAMAAVGEIVRGWNE